MDLKAAKSDAERYLREVEREEEVSDDVENPIAMLAMPQMDAALSVVKAERVRQDERWGWFRDFPDGTGGAARETAERLAKQECQKAAKSGRPTWGLMLEEKMAEAMAETDGERLYGELQQVAAVAVAWMEAIRRRGSPSPVVKRSWWRRLLMLVGLSAAFWITNGSELVRGPFFSQKECQATLAEIRRAMPGSAYDSYWCERR